MPLRSNGEVNKRFGLCEFRRSSSSSVSWGSCASSVLRRIETGLSHVVCTASFRVVDCGVAGAAVVCVSSTSRTVSAHVDRDAVVVTIQGQAAPRRSTHPPPTPVFPVCKARQHPQKSTHPPITHVFPFCSCLLSSSKCSSSSQSQFPVQVNQCTLQRRTPTRDDEAEVDTLAFRLLV